jgi:hypothetical protein
MLGVGAGSLTHKTMLLSGIAGLVAGALSMACGEYISVASQRDAEEADVQLIASRLAGDAQQQKWVGWPRRRLAGCLAGWPAGWGGAMQGPGSSPARLGLTGPPRSNAPPTPADPADPVPPCREQRQRLVRVYIERGLPPHLAHQVAQELGEKDALQTHAREELNIDLQVRRQGGH